MSQRTIFVGGPRESNPLAKVIALKLNEAGYVTRCWWDKKEFPPGTVVLDRLMTLARSVDGAVFLGVGVDKTSSRNKTSQAPRDNVILEYGLFVDQLGRERCLLTMDDDIKIPSDLAALTHIVHLDQRRTGKREIDHERLADLIVDAFDRAFSKSAPQHMASIPLLVDPDLAQRDVGIDPLPLDWHQRELYFGSEGARNWLSVLHDPNYELEAYRQNLIDGIMMAVDKTDPRTVVSLGPGDARLDFQILSRLRIREPFINYIPVDISHGLLYVSMMKIAGHATMPVGLLTDFEDRFSFVEYHVHRYASKPLLVTLLGNTLGNLEQISEETFFYNIRALMGKKDYFLFDTTTYGTKWRFDKDPRTSHAGYGPGYRKFIASGIARRTGEPAPEILKSFEKRVAFREGKRTLHSRTIEIVDAKFDRVVFRIRRYNWDAFLKKLDLGGFSIEFQEHYPYDGLIGDGVALMGLD